MLTNIGLKHNFSITFGDQATALKALAMQLELEAVDL
jgi:hypothetical protein